MTIKDTILKRMSSCYRDDIPNITFKGRFVYVPLYVTFDSNNETYYFSEYVTLKDNYNYNDLVDEFIRLVYSDKEMFAIINNYLLDPENEVALNEFNEMQAIRKEAKDLAKSILADYPLN